VGQPTVVMGDRISGQCAIHLIPNPSGSPTPSPPLPFSAPITSGTSTTVLVGGKPVAVQGSSGVNVPPHVGLHPSDPSMAPAAQQARVVMGSSTVRIDGKPAAYTGCSVTVCASLPGTVVGSATTVLIGA
jgi:uncharacterized Zn-binding protein involved in type VI secretion